MYPVHTRQHRDSNIQAQTQTSSSVDGKLVPGRLRKQTKAGMPPMTTE